MPVDTQGNVSRPGTPIPVTGQEADAPQVNVPINDIYAVLNLLQFLDGRKPMRANQDLNGYRVRNAADAEQPQDYVTLSQLEDFISTLSQVPTGIMSPISGNQVPAGWVRANGQSLVRADYPGLWAFAQASGNLAATQEDKTAGQYGPGDGSVTFTLPNLEAEGGYFIRPISSGRGIGTVQSDQFKEHTHTATSGSAGAHAHDVRTSIPEGGAAPYVGIGSSIYTGTVFTGTTQPAGAHTHPITVAETGGAETRPQNIAYPVIIKT